MQVLENQISFKYGRSPMAAFQYELISVSDSNRRAPAYIPEANEAARLFADQAVSEEATAYCSAAIAAFMPPQRQRRGFGITHHREIQ